VTVELTIPSQLSEVLPQWRSLAKRWALKPEERAALVGGPDRDLDTPLEDYRLLCGEQRIRLMVAVDAVFARIVGDDAAVRGWLRQPNPNLGERTPMDVMAGTPEWMQWLIDNLGGAR
jgi:uncharacterized protein (DUF2384 family)